MVRQRSRGRRGGGAGSGAVTALLGVVLLLVVAVTACSGSGRAEESASDGSGAAEGSGGDRPPAPVEISISPGDGARNVETSGALEVTAERGRLTRVTVTDADGRRVAGALAEDGTAWRPSEHLANATRYAVEAVAENAAGRQRTQTANFRTVRAESTFGTTWNVGDGAEVGVGMILSVVFDTPIEDTAAVRDAIEITSEPAVDVRGHWFGQQRLDFRPEEYWEPGTEVTVRFGLRGVEGADGVYGTLREEIDFTVGRSQISTVDAEEMTMEVVRDGERLRTLPVTTGAPGTETWNGRMVITERLVETRMDGATVGFAGEYDIPDVPHAMRLSDSGTFIHGNYWAGGAFGTANVSHGCIGLRDVQGAYDDSTPGAWFFERSIVGDVVEVVNSNDEVISPDNGLSGWNMEWSAWGAGQ
ncbi:L,D-transpeptidase [Streptomyces sp. 4N509B]|uniref:L,D-transpeptidase n=1 Tax=Streptomyces sp. 4N509B TaxID=3457413 RepID=UPI003FD6796C